MIKLRNLKALQEKDYHNESIQHENLMKNIKRSRSPPSLFIQQISNADVDMQDDTEFQSNTIEGSFNTKFNDIKPVGIFYS